MPGPSFAPFLGAVGLLFMAFGMVAGGLWVVVGGLILAYMAWKDATKNQKLVEIDGLTPAQRFFVGYGQSWCANERPENMRMRAMTDPHSPGKTRTNGVVVNMPEFQEAFHCKTGQPMAPEKRCRVW